MPKQKLTHEIEWEPVTGSYRILKITGSQRQPTMAEAQEYLYQNHLPEEIWVAGFYHSGEWDDWTESRTLELREYTALKEGMCPICHQALDLYHDKNKCPCCGKTW